MKKICSIIIIIAILMALTCNTNAATTSRYYTDVYTSDSYHDAVIYLYEHNILTGTTAASETNKGTFSPNSAVTRGQLVTVLWRMLQKPDPEGTQTTFTDCVSTSSYYNAVIWASSSEVGIVTGYEDGTFKPGNAVSQQEILTFLYRFACYCGYTDNSTTTQNNFKAIFNSSELTYQNNFYTFAKAATGWAIYSGVLTDLNINPLSQCTRASIATYIHNFYKIFQRGYALTVVNTYDMDYASSCATAIRTALSRTKSLRTTIISTTDISKSSFVTKMQDAFSQAKKLDLCYLYLASHGSTSGLSLFSGTSSCLTPSYLRSQIDLYEGTFVVLISGCYSGVYVSKGITQDIFDADQFVNELIGNDTSDNMSTTFSSTDLRSETKIKVICSSRQSELSYSSNRLATYYWCLGMGYDMSTGTTYSTLAADSNSDSRISLSELFEYSYDMVELGTDNKQHLTLYPYPDDFIIFETKY